MKNLLPILASAGLLIAGIKTDFSRDADFGQFKTYSWMGAKTGNNPWANRIAHDVDVQLRRKGWTKLQSGGDTVISAFGRTTGDQTLQTFYTGVDGGWNWHGAGENAEVGTLVVDVFDGHTKKLLWRASATETISVKPDSTQLEQAVQYMFRDFPTTTK